MILGFMPVITIPPIRIDELANKFNPTLEYRSKFERRTDRDFKASQDDNRSDLFQRFRPGFNYSLGEKASVIAQYQYSHDLIWTAQKNSSVDTSNIYQGFLRDELSCGTLTLGRQAIAIGDTRLIGLAEWNNFGRTWDGVRFKSDTSELVAARLAVEANPSQEYKLGVLRHAITKDNWVGAWYKHNVIATGAIDVFTLNDEGSMKIGDATLNSNLAYQGGHVSGARQDAWAIHLDLSKKVDAKSTVRLDFTSASGGGDASTSRSFDMMLLDGHNFCGIMDLQGWRNVNLFAASFARDLGDGQLGRVRLITSGLRDSSDAWYATSTAVNKSGSVTFSDPTGSSGSDLGREIDFEYSKIKGDNKILAGVGFFLPGTFVSRISGDNRYQMYGYLTFQTKM